MISGSLAENDLKLKTSYGSPPPYIISSYVVAMIRRLLKNIGLLCRILSLLLGSFANNDLQIKTSYGSSSPCTISSYGVAMIIRLL